MNLSRDEWEEMWWMAKKIEKDSDYLYFKRKDVADRIKENSKIIQNLIESVIGQME